MLIKARPELGAICKLVGDYTDGAAAGLRYVEGGELSQAYFFEADSDRLVLRVNHTEEGFRKDEYAADNLAAPGLVIPRVLEVGQFDGDRHYAISKHLPGKGLSSHDPDTRQKMLPGVIALMDAVHTIEPPGSGYGLWTPDTAEAPHESWRSALLDIENVYDWTRLFSEGIIERRTYSELIGRMADLIDFCPEERGLMHRDCGSSNILSDGEEITGVIDWAWSSYGDTLYDVACLDVGDPDIDYEKAFCEYFSSTQGKVPDNYQERVQCYRVYGGLLGLGFFAQTRQPFKYQQVMTSLERSGAINADG